MSPLTCTLLSACSTRDPQEMLSNGDRQGTQVLSSGMNTRLAQRVLVSNHILVPGVKAPLASRELTNSSRLQGLPPAVPWHRQYCGDLINKITIQWNTTL